MSDSYDVIVIGAGPAGYPAAIRAGQNKLTVACVDEWKNTDGSYAFGGTCLNAGCIPSKALLESSELYHRAKHEFAQHGIKIGDIKLDLAQMQKRRATIVKTMTNGIASLLKSAGAVGIQGHGRLLPGNSVQVTAPDGSQKTLQAKHVVLASGSTPIRLAAAPHDGKYIVDSWNALEFDAVPRRLGVIGAGVIGLELGSVWSRLGSEVTVLEALPDLLPMVDQTIAREAQRHFKKQGLDIKLGAKVTRATVSGSAVDVVYSNAQGEHALQVDKLIVAVGRRPFTQDLLAEGTGVELDARGFIQVDEHCRTSAANVWAVGDVVRGPMLAHKGKEEGIMVADLIAGRYGEVNYKVDPLRDLHRAGNCLGGPHGRTGQGERASLQGRRVSFRRERARPRHGSRARHGEDRGRHRTTTRSWACTSWDRWPASSSPKRCSPWNTRRAPKTCSALSTRIRPCPRPFTRPHSRRTSARSTPSIAEASGFV